MTDRKRIELSLDIDDFGPITSGRIILKPFTLFIGPNNSGKSYAAMVIHSIFESYSPSALSRQKWPFMRWDQIVDHIDTRTFEEEFQGLGREILDLKEGEKLDIPAQFIEKAARTVAKEVYERALGDELARSFACRLGELVRIGKDSFSLKILFDSHSASLVYEKDKLNIAGFPKLNLGVKIEIAETLRYSIEEEPGLGNEFNIRISRHFIREVEDEVVFDMVVNSVLRECASAMFLNIATPCYYLPAARSGILQGHRALAASIIRKAPYVGIEKLMIPRLSGVVSDFISSILTLPEERGPFYELARDLEREIIGGEIALLTLDEYLYPEINYTFQNAQIPLHRASSTVSELAPLILYLKYYARPRSILMIEEPEAHLHPKNQRILAKYLVRLIRKEVSIVVTTHSEYLLEQMSSFILLSRIEPKRRSAEYDYREDDYLDVDEVGAYVFQYDKESGGHLITAVEVSQEDGISQAEFIRVHEALYEESIGLRKELDNGAGLR